MTESSNLTDLEKVRGILLPIITSSRTSIDEIEEILKKNQNGPPDGAGDGSFDDSSWNALYDMILAVKRVIESGKDLGFR